MTDTPHSYGLDAAGYLKAHGGRGRALTKAEHDQLVAARNRPVTDGTIRRHHQNTSAPDGAGVVSLPVSIQ